MSHTYEIQAIGKVYAYVKKGKKKILLWTSQSSKLIMGTKILVHVIIEDINIHLVD